MRVPIVNEQDELIEYKDMNDRKEDEIIRVAALWLINEKSEILLAQRSLNKKRDPGCWGPAVAGTVEEGETYESNIIKEAEEEIGLKDLKPTLEIKNRRSSSHEYFGQWFTKDEILKLFAEKPEIFLPGFDKTINYFLKHETQS